MIDIEKLDSELQLLVKKRNQLSAIGYDNPDYDDIEEELHDLEDDFVENYGDFIEEALHQIHDEYCPDNDVLLPIAYMAKSYNVSGENQYTVSNTEGVFVDADDYPGKNTRLVLIPNPTRFVLNIDRNTSKVVWTAGSEG